MLQDQAHISLLKLLHSDSSSLRRLRTFLTKEDWFLLAKIKIALLLKAICI